MDRRKMLRGQSEARGELPERSPMRRHWEGGGGGGVTVRGECRGVFWGVVMPWPRDVDAVVGGGSGVWVQTTG